ncbi:MAG: TIM barrel protein [Dehalococcoidia bacterium]|nr:TIM barrel protein [Dehalococcoidia bacterium]MDP6782280.1 TIM barrel protein [Dehalococcoidia bacterium]
MALLFGTAGVPHSSKARSTAGGIERLRELGLDCMELEFVQGVRMGEAAAHVVHETALEHGIRISAHAPYYINLNAHEEDKLNASQARLLQTARIGALCGTESAVFHAGFYLKDPPELVYRRIKAVLEKMAALLRGEGNPVVLRPELTGKFSQFGTVDELLSLSAEVEGVLPTLDFSHFHARCGECNSYAEFMGLLHQVEARLGPQALKRLHIHLSGIEYTRAGERRHLDLKISDMRYEELLRALKDRGAEGMLICESPNLEEDALLLKETFSAL